MNKLVIVAIIAIVVMVTVVELTETSRMDSNANHDDINSVKQQAQRETSNENEYSTQELKSRNEQINEEFAILNQNYSGDETLDGEQYYQELLNLRRLQLELFEDVENHKFGDDEIQKYNYWYRSTLKFPSSLEQELINVEENR